MPSVTASVEVDATVDFEVFCAQCGAGLCNSCTEGRTPNRGVPYIQVEPCEKCIENARGEGEEKGFEEGKEAGRAEAAT